MWKESMWWFVRLGNDLFSWQQHLIIICCFLRLICILFALELCDNSIVRQKPSIDKAKKSKETEPGAESRKKKKTWNEYGCANKTMKHGQQFSSRLEKSISDGSKLNRTICLDLAIHTIISSSSSSPFVYTECECFSASLRMWLLPKENRHNAIMLGGWTIYHRSYDTISNEKLCERTLDGCDEVSPFPLWHSPQTISPDCLFSLHFIFIHLYGSV